MNPDGSEDNELKVKGLPDITVGDYTLNKPEDTNVSDDHHMIAYLCGGVVALRSHTLW